MRVDIQTVSLLCDVRDETFGREFVPDPSAKVPEGWLEDEEEWIADDRAIKPSDWYDDDGDDDVDNDNDDDDGDDDVDNDNDGGSDDDVDHDDGKVLQLLSMIFVSRDEELDGRWEAPTISKEPFCSRTSFVFDFDRSHVIVSRLWSSVVLERVFRSNVIIVITFYERHHWRRCRSSKSGMREGRGLRGVESAVGQKPDVQRTLGTSQHKKSFL